jgi:hypothetical protein
MKPAVVHPVVVLTLVAAAWAQAPVAAEAKGGPAAKLSASAGLNFTKDGRTEVFSSTETDLVTGEVSVREVVREFDNRGLWVHERVSETVDGHVVNSEETAFTYGQAHRLSQAVTVTDPDGEGPVPASVRVDTLTRNNKHKLISIVSTIDEDGDGVVDSTETETRDFDPRGRVVSTRTEIGGFVTIVSLTYDSHGNVLASTTDTDDLSTPQSPDSRDTSTATYDSRNLVSRQSDQSFVFDVTGHAQLVREETITFSRSNRGFITGVVQTTDSDGDGDVDVTTVSTATFDNQGHFLTEHVISHDGADVFEFSRVNTNDAKGRPVQVVYEEFLNGVGTFGVVEINTFDKFGRTIMSVDSWDLDGDGNADEIETFTAQYDNQDRQTFVTDSFTDSTGALIFSSTRTTVYGKNTSTATEEVDSNGDGTIDRRVVSVSPL